MAEPGKGGVALEGLLPRGVGSSPGNLRGQHTFLQPVQGRPGCIDKREGPAGRHQRMGVALWPLIPHPQKSRAWPVYTGSGRQVSRLSLHGKTPGPAIWGVLMGVKVHQGAVRGFLGLRKERFLNLCIY